MNSKDLSQLSMLELFQADADEQLAAMTASLLALERTPAAPEHLEALMRAAHSIKGAARIVELGPAVQIAHALEDCFVAAQRGELTLEQTHMDLLLQGVDLLAQISTAASSRPLLDETAQTASVEAYLGALTQAIAGPPQMPSVVTGVPHALAASVATETPHRGPRVRAEHVNRMLGLAGESLVESRWLKRFGQSLLRLKQIHRGLAKDLGEPA